MPKRIFAEGFRGPWICHICGYQISPCPKRKMGVLKLKNGAYGAFYGCSNFSDPEINCRYTKNAPHVH